MDASHVVGLDIGTSSVKASVWDAAKEQIVLQLSEDYPASFDHQGQVRQDPEAIYEAVVGILKNIVATLEKQASGFKSFIVVLDTALHSLLFLNKEMNPITDIIPWMDTRADAIAVDILRSKYCSEIHKRTGCPVDSVYPLYKIIWFAENDAPLMNAVGKIAATKDYLLYRLTGEHVIDYSVASGSGCLETSKRTWADDLLLELAGVSSAKFPTVVSPSQVLKPETNIKEIFKSYNSEIAFLVGISDAAASSIGTTCYDFDAFTISMGTSAAIRRMCKSPFNDSNVPNEGIWCYIVDEENYIIGMAMRSGGCVIDWWLKNFLQSNDYDEITNALRSMLSYDQGISTESMLPIFIPTVYGERVPRWMPDRAGTFIGFKGATTIYDATKSVMQGIAFNLKRVFESVKNYFNSHDNGSLGVVATGGMCQIENWLGFLASVLNCSMTVRESKYDASVGLIMFYLKDRASTVFKAMSANSCIVSPDRKISLHCNSAYSKWLNEMISIEKNISANYGLNYYL